MKVTLDINQRLLEQFAAPFDMRPATAPYMVEAKKGVGQMSFIEFPDKLELYHFHRCKFPGPVEIISTNASDSDWHLIHVNLSTLPQKKQIMDGPLIEFHRHLPAGVLLYGRNLHITTVTPPNVEAELASIRFHKSFFKHYYPDNQAIETRVNYPLTYEDLDYSSETALMAALDSFEDRALCHSHLLKFLGLFFQKLKAPGQLNEDPIHPDDLKGLLRARALLRSPLNEDLPTLAELAQEAGMGVTKFKLIFKQVFGCPPMQYHHKIKMEYARDALLSKKSSPSQLSYELGYSHPSNFTSAYKKCFGELPSSI